MKPINEMTLSELQESLRWMGDNNNNIPFEYIQKACYDYANRINELARWIPVSERMPNHLSDYVYVYYDGMVATMLYSIDKGFHGSTPNRMEMFAHEITHWKRITSPEGV